MDDTALLVKIAARKGRTVEDQASRVLYRAGQFNDLVAAAVDLREDAEGLLDPALATPQLLGEAVEELRQRAAALKSQLIPDDLPDG